jgi:hypothetical protein
MFVKFAECDRNTLYLLPPSVQDWLPEGHLARFVVEIVDHLDLRSLKASYAGRGSKPYNPEMLVPCFSTDTPLVSFPVASLSGVRSILLLLDILQPIAILTMTPLLPFDAGFCPNSKDYSYRF